MNRYLKAALRCTEATSPEERDGIRDDLEQYYLCLPEDLLSFNNIVEIHEAETMIWFHGTYILTCM